MGHREMLSVEHAQQKYKKARRKPAAARMRQLVVRNTLIGWHGRLVRPCRLEWNRVFTRAGKPPMPPIIWAVTDHYELPDRSLRVPLGPLRRAKLRGH